MRHLAPVLAIVVILLSSATTSAYDYLHCDSVIESTTDTFSVSSTQGIVGDTVFVYFRATTVDDVAAFFLIIRFDSSRIFPLTYSGPFVEIEPLGRLKTVMDTSTNASFFAQLSQNPADSGALLVLFGIDAIPDPIPEIPSGNGAIFRVPFVIKPQFQNAQFTQLWFHEINESILWGDSTITFDCRRSEVAIIDQAGLASVLFPTMLPGTVQAFDASLASITATLTTGGYGTDSIRTGSPVVWTIRYTNSSGYNATGTTNGFSLTSSGSWSGLVLDTLPIGWSSIFDLGTFINSFSITGSGADTVGLGGASIVQPGFQNGFDADVATLTATFDNGQSGTQVCLDTSWYPPAGAWLWSTTGGPVVPSWNGPHCYTLFESACRSCPPYFDNCAVNLGALDHCQIAMASFSATDIQGLPITFNQLSGPGSLTDDGFGNATWIYQPSLADVGVSIPTVNIEACNFVSCSAPCGFDLSFSNQAPTIACPGGPFFIGCARGKISVTLVADPVDCDPIQFFICGVDPRPVGPVTVDPLTGVVTFDPDPVDLGTAGGAYDVCVGVTDGLDTSYCTVEFAFLFCEIFSVHIEKTHNTIQGGHEQVDVLAGTGSETIGGFDFLISYDASALTLTAALEGSIYAKCGWEYFTYRYNPIGNCSVCPSGMVRIVGIAETNNGPSHPACLLLETGDTYATLDFLVSDDRTLECQYVPIRFYWEDCGDNTLSSQTGDSAFISWNIFEYDGLPLWDEDDDDEFPEDARPQGLGAPDICLNPDPNKPSAVRFVNFHNGGIDIICADSIDARGDINLNDIANEIADAVLYSNYFVHGLSVLNINVEGQIAASDVNADGLSLTVADLVYLIRIIVGDALSLPKTAPVEMEWMVDNDILSISGEIGAAAIVISGNVTPELLASGVEMLYNFDGSNTRLLLYSMEKNVTISGEFLRISGDVVSLEMATYDGAPVIAKAVPVTYSLQQNYPNPFNPVTTISFQLAQPDEYRLEIFNVAGRKVRTFAAYASSGRTEIKWDASGMASGLYYYRLSSGDYVETRKMILLK